MDILFATSSFGLGHATRDLPLMKALLGRGHRLFILSTGRALALLQHELGGQAAYFDVPDYPGFVSRRGMSTALVLGKLPFILSRMRAERAMTTRLAARHGIDRIITDGRYGVSARGVPSYWLNHQLRFIAPYRLAAGELLGEWFNARFQRHFEKVLVVDEEDDERALTGDLSHNLRFHRKDKLAYLGILSGIQRQAVRQDIDCFISVSGIEPQRTIFEKHIIDRLSELDGRVVVSLGKPEERGPARQSGNAVIHEYLGRRQQAEMMNRARLVITRAGYTTLMELAELGRKALIIPTPGQTEQEYLARHNPARGYWHGITERQLVREGLERHVREARRRKHPTGHRTARSVRRFLDEIDA
jgi:UDP-N-acetylglucosamine transferase subunit ALG13